MIEPMLAKNLKDFEHRIQYPVMVQPKINGLRMIAEFGKKIYSRTGKPLQLPPGLLEDLKRVTKFRKDILDGELYAHGIPLGRICGNAKRLVSKDQDVTLMFYVFDIVEDKPFSKRNIRLANLPTTDNVNIVPTSIAKSHKEVMDFLDIFIAGGYEGIMVRNPHAPYQQKRTKDLLKFKPWHYIKVVITAFVEGKGKYKGMLGAFVVNGETKRNGLRSKKFRCNVGSGFTDIQRQEFWSGGLLKKKITIKYIELTEYDIPYSPIFVKLG